MDDGRRHVPRFPPQESRAHSEIGVISKGEEVLVEATGLFKDLSVIQRGAPIRPESLFRLFELTDIRRLTPSSSILAVPIDQVAGLIDDVLRILQQDLAREHADAPVRITVAHHLREPLRFCDGIRVEQRDPLAPGVGEGNVVSLTESRIGRKEHCLSLIHISEPTRLLSISYAV